MDLRITFFSFIKKILVSGVYSPMTTGTLGLMIPAFQSDGIKSIS
jgi:hypothetical protein